MNKPRIFLAFLLVTVIMLCSALTASAEAVSVEDVPSDSVQEKDLTVWIVIASVLAFAAAVSVVVVNKKTAKYRKMFKKKKR